MNHLFFQDLKDKSEKEVKEHLIENFWGVEPTQANKKTITEYLAKHNILIAYEIFGSLWGESLTFYLFQNKDTNKLQELHAAHDSYAELHGQFEPENTNLTYLKSNKFDIFLQRLFYNDRDKEEGIRKIKELMANL